MSSNQICVSYNIFKVLLLITTISGLFKTCLHVPSTEATSMYYKKVQGEKYEPDWVAVSSTVIPLVERNISVGLGSQPGSSTESNGDVTAAILTADEYYKRAYVKHISKKYTKIGTAGAHIHPGTLITGKTSKGQ